MPRLFPPDIRCFTLENGECTGAGCMHDPLEVQIAAAIADPGSFAPRDSDYTEPLYHWSARIIMEILKPYLKDPHRSYEPRDVLDMD